MKAWQYEAKFQSGVKGMAYEREEECLHETFALLDLCLAAGKEERSWFQQPENSGCWPYREEMRREVEAAEAHIRSRIQATLRAGCQTRLFYVKQLLEMGELEFFGMVCILAAEHSRQYGRIFASLQGDNHMRYATPGLVTELYELAHGPVEGKERAVFFNLSRPFWLLVKPDFHEAFPYSFRPLSGGTRLLQFLYGNGIEGTLLGRTARMLTGTREPVCLYEKEFSAIQAAWKQMGERNREPGVLLVQGKPGSGKKFLLRRLAGLQSREVCCICLADVLELSREEREEWFRELRLERLLSSALFVFEEAEALFLPETGGQLHPQAKWLLNRLADLKGPFALLGASELAPGLFPGVRTFSVSLKMPGPRQKIRMWEFFGRMYPLEEDVSLKLLGNQYVLTVGELEGVLKNASLLAGAEGKTAIGRRHLAEAVASHNGRMLGDMAVRIHCVFSWEDLVVDAEVQKQLEYICGQVKYRSVVADDWNFFGKTPYGRGVCALFYGSPGTGKTMAAQVIARELGLELYRIDLSQLISKYIGETEKHISELFEKAKDINAVLFFDEADALFAKRSDVSDSNDRSANMETAHLLQKLEEYEGIVILATNLKDNIDEAFRRRIKFMIRFSLPDEETRRMLWEKVIPREAPLGDEVDLAILAHYFELSGSAIKEIALNAAYMAAADGGSIENRHLAEALRLNYAKLGKQLTGEELGVLI